ncbi:hypothetical protein HSB1_09640 [Halogranum salarium B-1]|uniref:Uncharacterized protein n=1 Tax=Halogranum salarium B-1 TaxID=1210908 RepID=J3JGT0_9EURY|nr:hypothetical protein HSB1_09640 [Halogranum salarium B-1]
MPRAGSKGFDAAADGLSGAVVTACQSPSRDCFTRLVIRVKLLGVQQMSE